ncbi:helix-turn-helix transcriptional regulator [Chryseobacterium sp. SIMBA_028]|uniref:helix-turn-helix transcriptional regulator n=2 Tax=unclassified Chryseobacterium TaxID=2593645 RepID=UPI00397BAF69
MFNTEIYPTTAVYILLFLLFIGIATIQLFTDHKKKKGKGYYLKYIAVMCSGVLYNLVEGMLPDHKFGINIIAQNILAWTIGVLTAYYYLMYIKNEYDLILFKKKISFETIGIFLLIMLIILFILPYTITQSLEHSRIIFLGFFLAILSLILLGIFRQQYEKFMKHDSTVFKLHEINGFLAFMGLVSLPTSILLFGDNQLIEQTGFSFGFFIITLDFFLYPKRKVIKYKKLFDELSTRESEILTILLKNPLLKYSEISQKLNISEKALSSHLSNIYKKTGLRNKKEIEKLSSSSRELLITQYEN